MRDTKVFDDSALSWAEQKTFPWNKMRYELTRRFILENINEPPRRILNIGCGDGIESFMLDSLEAEHVLVDHSKAMIDQAQEFLTKKEFKSKVEFICTDAQNLDTKVNGKFDLVILHNVLEYVENPDDVLSGASRLINDNGLFLCKK
jgi:S-adenosylmethionine-dependent methyltransferase